MKKLLTILPAALVVAVLMNGCALERDNFDKWLTGGTWNASTFTLESNNVVSRDWVNTALIDYVNTDKTTTTFDGSVQTKVTYQENKPSTGFTTWDKTTLKYNYTLSFTFKEDGTFEGKYTTKQTSYQHEDQSVVDPIINITEDPSTYTVSGNWSWGNDTKTKRILNIDNLGSLNCEISKDKLTIKKSTSNNSVEPGHALGEDYTETTTNTDNNSWSFGK